MNQVADYFQQSELALAAYANLTTSIPDITALVDAGMSDVQAAAFSLNYTVLAQSVPTANGFSATLFLNNQTALKGPGSINFLGME